MSLKELISTLIESAFTSKKSFISNQAMPSDSTQEFRQEISTQRHTAQTTSVCDTPAFGFRLSKVQRLGLVLTEVPRRHYGATQQSARLSFAQGGVL